MLFRSRARTRTLRLAGLALIMISSPVNGLRPLRAEVAGLFGVAPGNVVSLLLSAAILSAVAILSTWLPARRAASVNPIEALRTE